MLAKIEVPQRVKKEKEKFALRLFKACIRPDCVKKPIVVGSSKKGVVEPTIVAATVGRVLAQLNSFPIDIFPEEKEREGVSSEIEAREETVKGSAMNKSFPRLMHVAPVPRSRGKFFAQYTCLGVVGAPPHEVWDMIREPSRSWAAWLTSVSAVEEVDRRLLTPHISEYDVIQTTKMNLCGKKMNVDMHLSVNSNASDRHVSFKSKKGNKLMRSIEGRFQVWSLQKDGEELMQQFSHLNQKDLKVFLAGHGVDSSRLHEASLVLLEQAVQPQLMPPPPFTGMLKSHLGKHFDAMIADLQDGASSKINTSPKAPVMLKSVQSLL